MMPELPLLDHNTRVVLAGTTLLGAACGPIGTFLVLRRRALVSDAIAHATLPGVCAAFILAAHFGLDTRSLPLLLAGASLTGLLGMWVLSVIQRLSPIKDDAALGVVLSVFFGFGVSLLGVASRLEGTNSAGLSSFIYGKAASMLLSDAVLIAAAALVVALATLALFKEFSLTSFDPALAGSQGWPVPLVDAVLMLLALAVTVIGLQSVGLILMVALLVIPAAAARYWTHRLGPMLGIASAMGALSGLLGAVVSSMEAQLPTGALIVLAAALVFAVSILGGREGGLLWRWIERRGLASRIARQHVLRGLYELSEEEGGAGAVAMQELAGHRIWGPRELAASLASLASQGMIARAADGTIALTPAGLGEARRVVRNHRLWELFLIHHADRAGSIVDRDADRIEHVLDPQLVSELEAILESEGGIDGVPPSPHALVHQGTARA